MYRMYIGANNSTHTFSQEELDHIVALISVDFESFTYSISKGVFKGQTEDSMVVAIGNTSKEKVEALARRLAGELKQEGIGIEYKGDYYKLID